MSSADVWQCQFSLLHVRYVLFQSDILLSDAKTLCANFNSWFIFSYYLAKDRSASVMLKLHGIYITDCCLSCISHSVFFIQQICFILQFLHSTHLLKIGLVEKNQSKLVLGYQRWWQLAVVFIMMSHLSFSSD